MNEARKSGRIAVRDMDAAARDAPRKAPEPRPAPQPTQPLAPGIIGPGRRVTLHFALALGNGELIDSSFERAPLTFTIGDGNLPASFEAVLAGLAAGTRHEIQLAPGQAFGPVNEDNIQRFPRYRFPPDLALGKGLMVNFADAAGNSQAGTVLAFDAKQVEVDFNHPLAGRAILFTVEILRVDAEEQK